MTTALEEYEGLLRRGARVLDAIAQLYATASENEQDWADASAADTRNKRNSLTERLASPVRVTVAETSTLVVSLGHYLDSHWADYQEDFPFVNAQKRKPLELLHRELEHVVTGLGQIYNELRPL